MKFFRTNRADEAPFEVPIDEVVSGFLRSEWNDYPWPLQRSLGAFLTDPDGPINGTWENREAMDELEGAVLDELRRRQRKAQARRQASEG